jgi:hypothetical protein
MSIQKKSLIKTLKTTKKANIAASAPATNEGVSTRKAARKTVIRPSKMHLGGGD